MRKKAVDANKPRGPATPYTLFVRTCREELRRKYPKLTVEYSVISRKCSERWKSMNDQEKKRFNDTADLQRKRHKEEMATYLQEKTMNQPTVTSSILLPSSSTPYLLETPQQTQSQTLIMQTPIVNHAAAVTKKPVKKRERKPKDPLAPKKPLSAYFLFCAEERQKIQSSHSGMSVSDVAKELGLRWKNAPTELKSKYEQAASEKKDVYKNEMAAYKNQTSINSSPPETPQTPLTPSKFSNSYSTVSQQQPQHVTGHGQFEQLLLQQQNFNSYDASDLTENPADFDMMPTENPLDTNEV